MRRHHPDVGNALVAAFNLQWPPGSSCTVVKDLGEQVETRTRSVAWILGDGSPVVMLDGVAGGYALERVIPHRHEPLRPFIDPRLG